MKNTIKTLMVMGALLQGTGAFATIVKANINSGGKYAYTLKMADGVQAKCSDTALTSGKSGHIECQFMSDSLTKTPKSLFTITATIKQDLTQDCLVNGNLSDQGTLQLTPAGFCIDNATISNDSVNLQ